jgi:hypothetical protein
MEMLRSSAVATGNVRHLLGLAPAGYLAAPDNGPEGRCPGGCSRVPITGDGCLAVPLNLLNRVW